MWSGRGDGRPKRSRPIGWRPPTPEDVENAFSRLEQARRRTAALQREVDEVALARVQHLESYRAGDAGLIDVLGADRDLALARDQLIVSQAAASRAAVAGFCALGGGWSGTAFVATAQPPTKPR